MSTGGSGPVHEDADVITPAVTEADARLPMNRAGRQIRYQGRTWIVRRVTKQAPDRFVVTLVAGSIAGEDIVDWVPNLLG